MTALHVDDPFADAPPPRDAPPDGAPSTFDSQVAAELNRLRVRTTAADLLAMERATAIPMPLPVRLDRFLKQPDPDVTYRVDQLLSMGGRVVFSAPAKSGKTTARDGLVRSLVDGYPFLDRFAVQQAERVVLIDNELDERTLRRWLRAQVIEHTDMVDVVSLRGRVSSFDITDDATRSRWADALGGAEVLILDRLRPVLDALQLDESRDTGRFLVAFDALLLEAGIGEAVIVHHFGHGAERSRGDSRIRDWPDAEWRIVRDKGDDAADADPDASRYFAAYGRDVSVPEGLLEYDPLTRGLRLAGGSRATIRTDAALIDLLGLLGDDADGLSTRRIEDALVGPNHTQAAVRGAISRARHEQLVKVIDGPKRSKIHHITPAGVSVRCRALEVRQHTSSECVSASIDDALTHTTDGGQ